MKWRLLTARLEHPSSFVTTVKAQYKNNPNFRKGACCSYDLLAQALVPKEEQQVILKGAQLSGP